MFVSLLIYFVFDSPDVQLSVLFSDPTLNMYALSFLVVVLFIFDVSLVTARPQRRRSPAPVAAPVLEGLNTNAKRFAAGLPPLPPVRRWEASKVDSASIQLNMS